MNYYEIYYNVEGAEEVTSYFGTSEGLINFLMGMTTINNVYIGGIGMEY